jgi:hypothetical protein
VCKSDYAVSILTRILKLAFLLPQSSRVPQRMVTASRPWLKVCRSHKPFFDISRTAVTCSTFLKRRQHLLIKYHQIMLLLHKGRRSGRQDPSAMADYFVCQVVRSRQEPWPKWANHAHPPPIWRRGARGHGPPLVPVEPSQYFKSTTHMSYRSPSLRLEQERLSMSGPRQR